MIAKQLGGSSTKGTILYAGKKNGAELTIANDCFGSPKSIVTQFRHVQELNTRTHEENKTFHSTISLHKNDTNKLSKSQEIKLIQDYAKVLNLDKNQYVAYKHTDTEVPHWHFIGNRINEETKKATTLSFFKYKHLKFCKAQEKKLGLTVAVKPENIIPYEETTIIKNDNLQIDFLRIIIQQNLKKSKSLEDFIKRMEQSKIKTYLKGTGISFMTHDKVKINGSSVAREFSLKGIEKQISAQLKKPTELNYEDLVKQLEMNKIVKAETKKELTSKEKIDLGFKVHQGEYEGKINNIKMYPKPLNKEMVEKFGFELTRGEIKEVYSKTKNLYKGFKL